MSSRIAPIACGAAILGAAALVGGCSPVDYGLGEAVKYNVAVQTVNPEPVYAPGATQPGGAGEHGVPTVERYRKGVVKEPPRESTSSGGGSR